MHIIVAASQKGGAGKTTLIRSLAVATQQAHGPTAILDTDPQGSLTSWWNRREAQEPALVKFDLVDFEAGVAKLEAAGIEYLFVDTPPSVHPEMGALLARASLAIVPVRPSPDDLDAVGDTLGLIEEAGCPFLFVLTQAKPRTRLQMQAVMALAKHGKLAPTVMHDRTDFPTAAISGRTVTEVEPETASSREVRDVLQYVMEQLRKDASKGMRKVA
ncbi:ParA family protein [Methylobacterium nigriterrae]|uniref:ParA family protein n=1 Tax=Methylobacterium nigriterrae TaxID=3127512 RepID=UPI003013C6F7